jgi:hypothetical protein
MTVTIDVDTEAYALTYGFDPRQKAEIRADLVSHVNTTLQAYVDGLEIANEVVVRA